MNLTELLKDSARGTVPEPDPLTAHLDGIRTRVRRRRAVNRARAGALGVAGVAGVVAIGMLTWQPAQPDPPVGSSAAEWEQCGLPLAEAIEATSVSTGPAALTLADGMQVAVTTTVTNPGGTGTQATPVGILVYRFGGGDIVGVATPGGTEPTTLGPQASGEVAALGTIGACGSGTVARGDPLPDGRYGLLVTGALTSSAQDWHSDAVLIDVAGGAVTAGTGDLDPTADPTDASAGRYTPVCGEVTPAVTENPLAVTLGTTTGPHPAGDPAAPGTAGLSLDLTIGSVNAGDLTGTVDAQPVTMITDLDGRVLSWWRTDAPAGPGEVPLDLPADGTQVVPAGAWHPLTDTCTDPSAPDRPLPDGHYRVFVAVDFAIDAAEHPATWVSLSAPLELTVTEGVGFVG